MTWSATRARMVRRTCLVAGAIASWLIASPALGQYNEDGTPRILEDIDIVEHLGDALPLKLVFTNEEGRLVRLGDYFDGEKPVIITLNYYRCPMLCTFQLNGVVKGLRDVALDPGEDFRLITVSIDPNEGPDLAKLKKDAYVGMYARDGAAEAWSFLTGRAEASRSLADAIGFGYKWMEDKKEWAHGAAIFVVTPDGTISRYLYGLQYEPRDLRMALVEAGEGKVGTTIDRLLMWCYHYDDKTGQFTPNVMAITRMLGGLTVVALGTGIFILWRRDPNRRRSRKAGADGLARADS